MSRLGSLNWRKATIKAGQVIVSRKKAIFNNMISVRTINKSVVATWPSQKFGRINKIAMILISPTRLKSGHKCWLGKRQIRINVNKPINQIKSRLWVNTRMMSVTNKLISWIPGVWWAIKGWGFVWLKRRSKRSLKRKFWIKKRSNCATVLGVASVVWSQVGNLGLGWIMIHHQFSDKIKNNDGCYRW